jgi:glycosyltransferase involved in cell wall biosynthesis
MSLKHIFIPELSCAGHYSIYLDNISRAYLKSGCFVTVTILREFENHLLIQKLNTEFKGKFRLEIISDKEHRTWIRKYLGNIGGEIANWILFRKKFININSKFKIDYVFFPYFDYCMNVTGLLGSPFRQTPWSGICMSASIHHSWYKFHDKKNRLKWIKDLIFLQIFKIKTLKTLFSIDELLIKYFQEKHIDLINRIKYLADPGELKGNHSKESARKLLGISQEAIIVLVYGMINKRKGIETLLSAVHHIDTPKTVKILIVGEQDKSIHSLFRSKIAIDLIEAKRIIFINNFVDSTIQQIAFSAADIVWLGYNNHLFMSGVLVLAGMAKKVVIGSHNGLIGWHVRDKSLGITVDVKDINMVRKVLIYLSNDLNRIIYQNNISPIFNEYNWENATKCILTINN